MNELNHLNQFLKARSISKRLQQLSFNLSELEKRYSYGNMHPEDEEYLFKTYLAARFDLQDMADDLSKLEPSPTKPDVSGSKSEVAGRGR